MDGGGDPARAEALQQYKNKLIESREWEAKLKNLRMDIKGLQRDFEVTEDNIKALQSVGQIIGEVLKQLDEERCKQHPCVCQPPANCQQSLSKPHPVHDMLLAAEAKLTRPS